MSAQRGLTLLEWLVGMSLGLSVLGLALSFWQTSQQTWLALSAQQQLQHNVREAMRGILQQAELVGSAQLLSASDHASVYAVDDVQLGGAPDLMATDMNKGGDTLILAHWRSLDPLDCQGNRHGTAASVRQQFQRSTSTPNDLACKDLLAAGSTYQSLAEGIEDLQIRLAEVNADGHSLQWRTPAQVTQWTHVVALEVCLRMVSPARVSAASGARTGCQGETILADGHLRQVVRRIVRVRRQEALPA